MLPKIKPICAVCVFEENFTVAGDSESVAFNDSLTEQEFEMTWKEIYQACIDYREAQEQMRRRYA